VLFQQRFKDGIRKGSVTRTYRTWETPRVQVGKQYRLGPEDAVEVDAIEAVALGKIPAADAKKCGFADRDELLATIEKHAKQELTARSKVFRVIFRHVRATDPRIARRDDASAQALDEIAVRLERMDRSSKRGAWTRAVLRLIEKHPEVAASKLAPRLKRETRAFKADVRKLKELGLTVSHEVGYSLSRRGRALLKRLRQ
jgi:hypothetical protein